MVRPSYSDIRKADRDWVGWMVPGVVLLVLLGAVFRASHHDPWIAVIGVFVVGWAVVSLRRRQLRRRMAEADAKDETGNP